MLALALAVSIGGLLAGALAAAWGPHAPRARLVLDAATLALVPGLVLAHLLPHLTEDGGAAPILGLAAGYLGYQAIEARAHRRAVGLGAAVVLPALALHALFDGATLGMVLGGRAVDAGAAALVAAILLHRVPEGFFVGAALADRRGAVAWTAVGALGLVTLAGGLFGRELVGALPDGGVHVGVAVGLGIMVRMVVDRHDLATGPALPGRLASGVVFVACLALVIAMPSPEDLAGGHGHDRSVRDAVLPWVHATAPLLLALVGAAELAAARRRRAAGGEGAAPEACGGDGWAAGAVIGAVAVGPWLGALHAVAALGAAVAARRALPPVEWWLPRAAAALPAYAIGVAAAAAAAATLAPALAESVPGPALVAGAAVVGAALRLGAGAPVLAAVLAQQGAPAAAAIALVLATAVRASVPRVRDRIAVAVGAAAAALALGPLLERAGLPVAAAASAASEASEASAASAASYEWLASAALASWILAGLVRAGPRSWLRAS